MALIIVNDIIETLNAVVFYGLMTQQFQINFFFLINV